MVWSKEGGKTGRREVEVRVNGLAGKVGKRNDKQQSMRGSATWAHELCLSHRGDHGEGMRLRVKASIVDVFHRDIQKAQE